MKNFYSKFIKFSASHTLFMIVFLVAVIAGEALYLKSNLKIDTDLKALFHGDNEMVVELKKMEKLVGSYSSVLVVAKSPDREKNIEALRKIKEKIEGNRLVRFIEFDRDVSYLEKNALLFASIEELEEIKSRVQKEIAKQVEKGLALGEPNDGGDLDETAQTRLNEELDQIFEEIQSYRKKYKITKYYEAEGGRFVAMKVRPAGNETNLSDTKKIVDLLDDAIRETKPEESGVRVEAGGLYRNKLHEMEAIYDDVFSTLAICILLLVLTIIFYFRSFPALFIVLFPLSAGVLTAIGAMQFFVGGFNIISAFTFTILYGLGVDFSIHLLSRFGEEREKTDDAEKAMQKSSLNVLPAIFSGAITTVAAFFTLILIDFKGFSDFGVAAAIGVLTSFLAIIIFFPAILFAFDRVKPLKINPQKSLLLVKIFNFANKRPLVTAMIFLIITLSSFASLAFANVEYNFDNLTFPGKNDETTISNQYMRAVEREKSDSVSTGLPSFIVLQSSQETEEATRILQQIMKEKKKSVELKDFVSLYTFLPENQEEKIKIIKNIKRLIERKIGLFDEKTVEKYEKQFKSYLEVEKPMEKELLPDWIRDKLSLKDGSYDKFIMLALGGNKSNVESVIKIKEEYGLIHGNLNDYKTLGSYMLLAEIKNVVDKHVPIAITLAFVSVFIVLMLLYRSFLRALVVSLPLIAGIFWMILTAVLAGIKFNVFNMIVIPTVIGTGIDSAIHIFHRFRSSEGGDMPEILKNTGGAVFYSSLTTLVGFGSVAFARHKGLQSIGTMASLGIICAALVNLIFFPVLIELAVKIKAKRVKSKNSQT